MTEKTENKITVNREHTVFVERFRPKTIDDIILPANLKDSLKEWKEKGEIPNLLLTSKTPGLGKSSLAHVIIHELGAEAKFINASLESNIDLLRSKILGFVSTASFDGRPKIVVLDEADFLNANSTQPALRAFIEEFSRSARFILTANIKDKIIEPLRSRLFDIDFDMIFASNPALIKDIYIRCTKILEEENITYSADDLKYLVKHYYPSSRNIVMKIHQFSTGGKLVVNHNDMDIESITKDIRNTVLNNEFEKMRQLITKISDPSIIYTDTFDNLDKFPVEKRPPIIMCIAKYQAHDNLVRDRIINAAAMLTEIMTIIRKN